jgi:hypothetical protein
MAEFENLVGVKFDREAKGVASVKDKMGIFFWLNFESPSFGFTKPVDKTFSYKDLFDLTLNIEKYINNIVEKTTKFSKDVNSAKRPVYYDHKQTVFICHSSLDKDLARRLDVELEKKSINVWLDEKEIVVGQDFVSQMEKGLKESDFVIVVLSKNFVEKGPWAKEEYRRTLTRQVESNKTILLPILKEECEIPAFLRSKNYADFTQNFDDGLTRLLNSIRKLTMANNVYTK